MSTRTKGPGSPRKPSNDDDATEDEDEVWVYEEEEDDDSDDSSVEAPKAGESDSEEDDECNKCHKLGEVLVCDYCPRVYHTECAELNFPPFGICVFKCVDCGPDICDACREKEAPVQCRYCRRSYHGNCLHRVPDPTDTWLCPACQRDIGESGKVEKILTSRPYRKLTPAEEARRLAAWAKVPGHGAAGTAAAAGGGGGRGGAGGPAKKRRGRKRHGRKPRPPPVREVDEPEYLVRWAGKAYWHCSWVPESFLVDTAKIKLKHFKARRAAAYDVDLPEEAGETEEEDVVNPDWLQADRILDEREERSLDGKRMEKEYLVKWLGLEYDQSTWVLEKDLVDKGFAPIIRHFCQRDRDWVQPVLSMEKSSGDDTAAAAGSLATGKTHTGPYKPLETQPACFVGGTWHDYQFEGINFLRNSWYAENNVILADEMGLGKTIQALGFMRSIMAEKSAGKFLPFLVVCPLGVVDNWERECKRWCPDLDVVVYKGSQPSRDLFQRHEIRRLGSRGRPTKRPKLDHASSSGAGEEDGEEEEEEGDGHSTDQGSVDEGGGSAAGLKRRWCGNVEAHKIDVRFHVLVTSYDYAFKDAYFFKKIGWESVVVDEGHRLKAGTTGKLYHALKEMKVRHRLLLTGTPLQNSIEELFNLLHFLEPGKFSDVEVFKAEFASMDKEAQVGGWVGGWVGLLVGSAGMYAADLLSLSLSLFLLNSPTHLPHKTNSLPSSGT